MQCYVALGLLLLPLLPLGTVSKLRQPRQGAVLAHAC